MMNERIFFLSILFFVVVFLPLTIFALTVDITATVLGCGDAIIQSGEQCDGFNLGGASCSSQGFSSGSLSCSSSCSFNTTSCVSSGGGGGGGSVSIPSTNVVFSGRAYPLSRVSILKDGQLVVTTIAGPDSNFSATTSNLSTGNYIFALYGEDKNDVRSSLFTFPIFITSGVTTKIGGIFIAPTISVDKSEVKKGDDIAIFGQSSPFSNVTVSVNSAEEFFVKKTTDAQGVYLLNFDTSVLEFGDHHTKSKVALNDDVSPFGTIVGFAVGNKNVFVGSKKSSLIGDVNEDGRVNLIDFSILAFWYKKLNPPKITDLNSDSKIDLVDFSIMTFHWTG